MTLLQGNIPCNAGLGKLLAEAVDHSCALACQDPSRSRGASDRAQDQTAIIEKLGGHSTLAYCDLATVLTQR